MPTKQGSFALLNDPVARELLQSTAPARLAYVWPDGSPRVVPIWFHWNGKEIVLGTPLKSAEGTCHLAQTLGRAEHRRQHLAVQGAADPGHGPRGDGGRRSPGICPGSGALLWSSARTGMGEAGGRHVFSHGAYRRHAGMGRSPGLRDAFSKRD